MTSQIMPLALMFADIQRMAPRAGMEPPELNLTFSISFFLPRLLGQHEYEDEGGRQRDEAHP